MKKLLTLFSIIFVLLFLFSCQNSDVPRGMKLASDTSKVHYSLYVPKSWIIDSMDNISACHVSDRDRTSISIKKTSYSDEAVWWNDYKNAVTSTFDDFALLTDGEDIVISALNAKKYVFTCSFHGESFYKYEIISVQNSDSVYEISIKYQGLTKDGNINYTDTQHADTIKSILNNFKFNESLSDGSEVIYNADNTPNNMKCASNTKIVDYCLFVPSAWVVEKTVGTVSSAYASESDKTNISVMQWNVNSYNYDAWWSEYKLQLFSTFDRDALIYDDKGQVKVDENGYVTHLDSEIVTLKSEGVDAKLGENNCKKYEYSVKIGGNVYEYTVFSVMHRASVYVMTFTFDSQNDNTVYNADIEKITQNFRFD